MPFPFSPSMRSCVVFDRDAPMYTVFFRRIIARRLVIRATVVPDDDVALAPVVTILTRRLDHVGVHLLDDRIALGGIDSEDIEDLALIVIEQRASGFGMLTDERV